MTKKQVEIKPQLLPWPVEKKLDGWRETKQKVVWVTGVFDLLHIEHMKFLEKAKAAGDKLLVGVEPDRRVRQIKGDNRPVNPEMARVEQLNYLKPVDLAFILPEQFDRQEDWETLMGKIRPAVYAVSSHTKWQENKQNIAEKYGAEFKIVHQFNSDYSTSAFYRRLLEEE